MVRKIIPLITNERYHVFNRGVDKRDIFLTKSDYLRFYLSLDVFNTIDPSHSFEDAKGKHRSEDERLVQIIAYSLLPNHFHVILEQLVDGGTSEFLKRLQGGYTSYFNDRHDRTGTLFQGKFKRIHIGSDNYFTYLFAYVNENHFVHNIQRESDVCFSSSAHYQKLTRSRVLPTEFDDYSFKANVELAKEIAEKREIFRTEI